MSGLLQRLAGQALGVPVSGTPRIRPAASVHAQVPMGIPQEVEDTRPLTGIAPEAPRQREQGVRASTPVAGGSLHEADTAIRSIETVHEIAAPTTRARAADPHRAWQAGAREYAVRPPSGDFFDRTPQPLLEETRVASAPPPIAPVAPAPRPIDAGLEETRVESTEVHVHIGRIEVIAAPEPAAPKKSPKPAVRDTRPLDEYLARRRPS